jgi:hypothetical protein
MGLNNEPRITTIRSSRNARLTKTDRIRHAQTDAALARREREARAVQPTSEELDKIGQLFGDFGG